MDHFFWYKILEKNTEMYLLGIGDFPIGRLGNPSTRTSLTDKEVAVALRLSGLADVRVEERCAIPGKAGILGV